MGFRFQKFRFAGRVASTVFPACIPWLRTLDFPHAPAPWDAHREVNSHDLRGIKDARTRGHASSHQTGRAWDGPQKGFPDGISARCDVSASGSCWSVVKYHGPPAWEAGVKPSANGESVSYIAQSAAEYGT